MKVAVIGAGIFGCTAAIQAARAEHEVHLFERSDAIMQGASAVNQFRLHRGYHYPRSPETGRECRKGNIAFHAEYASAIIPPEKRKHGGQFYAIASEGSKVSAEDYLRFLDASNLPHRPVPASVAGLDHEAVDLVVEVLESAIDPVKLTRIVDERLQAWGVNVHLGASIPSRDGFDAIIIAAYAGTNEVARALGCRTQPFQFEWCEKPVVRLPERFRDTSVVVMDGPFCSIDPYGKSGLHVLGHVEHAILSTNIGDEPVKRPLVASRIKEFIESGSRFFPALQEAEHIRSMTTVRAVLPYKDATDERPTLVERLDDKTIRIFSGKLGTCVDAAREALFMLEHRLVAA